jgi:hypothetical protein
LRGQNPYPTRKGEEKRGCRAAFESGGIIAKNMNQTVFSYELVLKYESWEGLVRGCSP